MWIDGRCHSRSGAGLLVLMGTRHGDTEESCRYLANKVVNLRIFEDEDGRMNRSIMDIDGQVMVVSQFTLYADTHKGRRPAFTQAQEPTEAKKLYERFVELVSSEGIVTATGEFGAVMDVRFNNQGPVTIILEHPSEK